MKEIVSMGMGFQKHLTFACFKHNITDYAYDYNVYKAVKSFYKWFWRLFWFMSIILCLSLGEAWFEGVKIFGINICFIIAYSFWQIGKLAAPARVMSLLWLCGMCGCIYSLNSVQSLI